MRKLLVPCLIAAAVAILPAGPASAWPGSPATGTFSPVTMTITSTRTDGGNTVVTANRTAVLTGSFAGPTTDTVTIVSHSDGTTSVHGHGTCACTVDGISGTLSYQFVGAGTFPSSAAAQMGEAFLPNPAINVGFTASIDPDQARVFAASFTAPDSRLSLDEFVADILQTDGEARAALLEQFIADLP